MAPLPPYATFNPDNGQIDYSMIGSQIMIIGILCRIVDSENKD